LVSDAHALDVSDRSCSLRIEVTPEQGKSSKKWLPRKLNLSLLYYLPQDGQISDPRYEILSQPDTKELYDHYGMEGLSGPGGRHMDPTDIFTELFGGGTQFDFGFGAGGFESSRRTKGQDSIIPHEVTLEDLYNGKSVKLNLEKDTLCGACSG
jgi:hypothetical protein